MSNSQSPAAVRGKGAAQMPLVTSIDSARQTRFRARRCPRGPTNGSGDLSHVWAAGLPRRVIKLEALVEKSQTPGNEPIIHTLPRWRRMGQESLGPLARYGSDARHISWPGERTESLPSGLNLAT